MKIINLNSKYELSSAQISFIETVVTVGDFEPYNDKSLTHLMNTIPIFLVNEKTQNEIIEDKEPKIPNIDVLGFYYSKYKILNHEIPIIGLCIEKMLKQKIVKNDDDLCILIAKVLVHELAHARMDVKKPDKYDEFYKNVEEPFANFITLKCFEKYSKNIVTTNKVIANKTKNIDPFEFVKDFINSQPANYKMGLTFYENNFDKWEDWMKIKENYSNLCDNIKDAWNDEIKTPKNKTEGPNFKIFERLFYSFPFLPSETLDERVERFVEYLNFPETDKKESLSWMNKVDYEFFQATLEYTSKNNIDVGLKDSTKSVYKNYGQDNMGMF